MITPEPTNNAAPSELNKFEDCKALIDSLETASSIDEVKAGLRRLGGFFAKRLSKSKANVPEDSSAAVKALMTGHNRDFQKFTPRPFDAAPVK